MEPRIESIPPMSLVGIGERMSLTNDSTGRLWQALMPRRGEINNRVTDSYISMRVYSNAGMPIDEMFAPETEFEKWAAVEVADYASIPAGMQSYSLEGGTYAVFVHKGLASKFPDTMRYIFGTWLPSSDYELDDREHFEVVPEGWSSSDENAQEEIYVPITRAR